MEPMSGQTENRRTISPRIHPDIAVHLARADAHLQSADEHDERARLLREQREELERQYFGRRFILIRF
jgi:hypothetical protein